jgi:hypothetical protein
MLYNKINVYVKIPLNCHPIVVGLLDLYQYHQRALVMESPP